MRLKTPYGAKTVLKLTAATAALVSLSACAQTGMSSSTSMQLGAAAFAPQGYIRFCERRPDQCGLPTPIAPEARAELEHVLNRQQWANVLNLAPTSLAVPRAAVSAPSLSALPGADASMQAEPVIRVLAPATTVEELSALFQPSVLPAPAPQLSAAAALQPARPAQSRYAIHLTPMVWAALNGVNQSINARIRPMSDQQAWGVADYWNLPLSDGPRPVGDCKDYALEKRKALVEAGFSADALSLAIVRTGWGETHAVLIVGTDQGDYVLDNLSPWVKGWEQVNYSWIERQTPGQPLRWAALAADVRGQVYGAS